MPRDAKDRNRWEFLTSAPPREVFATTEQVIGTYPFRYEVTGPDEVRVVEFAHHGFLVGQWTSRFWRPRRWVSVRAVVGDAGTEVVVEASKGYPWLLIGKRTTVSRALQVVNLLSRGVRDPRTIYRDRAIPPGPVTLVASWAGMDYRLYREPRWDAERGSAIRTATHIEAIPGDRGPFVKIRVVDTGEEGFVERDQIVIAPVAATREAQLEAARFR